MSREAQARVIAGSEPGVQIALLDWGGEGPLALLHHANGFCAGLWTEVAETLCERFRVVALDARGHGDSSKPESPEAYAWLHFVDDLIAVAEQLALETPARRVGLGIGHSFGGATLLMAATQRPELFGELLLVDPVLLDAELRARIPAGPSGGSILAERTLGRRRVWPSRQEAAEIWAGRDFFASWTPRARELYARYGLRERSDGQVELKCPPEVEAAIFERGGTLDPLPDAHRVTAPTLFLHANRGNFPLAHYRKIAAEMPGGRVESLDVGHLVPMQEPAVVAEAALRVAQASTG